MTAKKFSKSAKLNEDKSQYKVFTQERETSHQANDVVRRSGKSSERNKPFDEKEFDLSGESLLYPDEGPVHQDDRRVQESDVVVCDNEMQSSIGESWENNEDESRTEMILVDQVHPPLHEEESDHLYKNVFTSTSAKVMLPKPSGLPYTRDFCNVQNCSNNSLATSSEKKFFKMSTVGCQAALLVFSLSDENNVLTISSKLSVGKIRPIVTHFLPTRKKMQALIQFAPIAYHVLLLACLLQNSGDKTLTIQNLLSHHIIPTWKTFFSSSSLSNLFLAFLPG